MANKNYSKPKYPLIILITISVLVAVMGITWLIMAFCAPSSFARFAYKMGWNNYAHTLYMRHYNKSKDINSLYKATNLSIKLTSYSNVVSEYELLMNSDKYNQLISKINSDNMALNVDNLTKSTLINEDEYLKNHYVLALVNTNKWTQALELAKSQLDSATPTVNNLDNYLFGYIIANVGTRWSDLQTDVYNDINAYFNALSDLFDNNFDANDEVHMFALCSKMMKVGNNIITLATKFEDTTIVNMVRAKLADVNSAMQTLLGE